MRRKGVRYRVDVLFCNFTTGYNFIFMIQLYVIWILLVIGIDAKCIPNCVYCTDYGQCLEC